MTSLDQTGRGTKPPPQKDSVAHYLDLGWALVPVPAGGKRPAGKGWQHAPVTTPEAARTVWRSGQGPGVGLLHSASGTAALDLDHEAFARTALGSVGVDLDALLTASGPSLAFGGLDQGQAASSTGLSSDQSCQRRSRAGGSSGRSARVRGVDSQV